MKKIALTFCILMVGTIGFSQKQTKYIGFYNIENLYDTINQANDDEEFLPNGANKWTSERYLEKLKNLNQVIDSMGNMVLLGFAEVENKMVLQDLNKASKTRKKYKIVHFDSPDKRGVDASMIYNPKFLKLVDSGKIGVTLEVGKSDTRDIVWAKFTHKKDTLFAMVNHWPSRRGGEKESEPNRIKAATTAAVFIDSVMKASPASKIVFMGDLNDYPTNVAPKMIAERLTPMISKASGKFGGTYNYKNEWDVLDHIMVSPNAFSGKLQVKENSGEIVSNDFLLVEYKGNIVPKRNYAGPKYLKGYSDHLPVRIQLK